MNIRKNIDYSDLFAALDAAMRSGLQQMEQYFELGRPVSNRPEKGAAVDASAHLKMQYPETSGFSPRNLRRMRDFYRLYEGNPDMLELAMQLSWTQNVVILEAELNTEERRWYLQAAKQFGWSKAELQKAIVTDTYQQRIPDEPIANSGTQNAASFLGELVFKSRVGCFQRKQDGAVSLKNSRMYGRRRARGWSAPWCRQLARQGAVARPPTASRYWLPYQRIMPMVQAKRSFSKGISVTESITNPAGKQHLFQTYFSGSDRPRSPSQ